MGGGNSALTLMKPYTTISLIILVLLALLPPINFFVQNPSSDKWLWMVLIAGLFGIFTIFLKTNWVVKSVAVGGFVNCFFSCAPYFSFTSYVSLVACCYLYIFASRIENWDLIFNVLKSILILNTLLIVMQLIGQDRLLNFGLYGFNNDRVGIIGQHMQMSSFSVILAAILIRESNWFVTFPIFVSIICSASWGLVSAFSGLLCLLFLKFRKFFFTAVIICFLVLGGYVVKNHKIHALMGLGGRFPAWSATIKLANQHPFVGWGIGTYKEVFPPLSGLRCIPYKTAHNCWLQLAFEIGYLGMGLVLSGFIFFGLKLFRSGCYSLFSGLVMISVNMMGHFPTRIINCVPLLILFFAYCESRVKIYGHKSI